ncbi:MAG TPA: hypothetical protein VHU82_09465 [Vicinamibacterales bacterium]|jgi:hypothetical protein|nr:hypothetical protein [Vicinamibacterales bacterium]
MPAPPDPHGLNVHGDRALFVLTVAAFLSYAALFIYRTSFVVGGERYFSLFDDAMVSMRYARNIAHGWGAVWNPGGERVEGYTNPLWVLYLALVHLLPAPQSKVSAIVQITGAICLAANLCYVRRVALAVSDGSRAVAFGAVVLTASYLPLNNWALQGMEVGVLALLLSIALWQTIQGLETGRFQGRLYLLLGIGTWIRPDMAVPFVAFLVFLIVADPRHRRQHIAWGLAALAAAGAVQTLFRLWYYGDILPNTYYLKMTGVPFLVRIARGLYVLLECVWKASPLLFVLAFATALRRDNRIRLLFWIFIVQIAYSVYVGGDAWEYWGGANRYICVAIPGFFVLLSLALHDLTRVTISAARGPLAPHRPTPRWAPVAAFALVIGYAVVSMNSIYGVGALAEALLIRPPLHTGSGGENQQDVEQAMWLRRATAPDATLAVVRAGTIPYFADRRSIDLLGKNDRHVAHGAARSFSGLSGFRDFRPGHMKSDFTYSIGALQPDVIVQLRQRTSEAEPFLRGLYRGVSVDGDCVHVRRGSSHVLWDRIPSEACGPAGGGATRDERTP